MSYRIVYRQGPVLTQPTLRAARRHVERFTPLRRGWTGTWVATGRGRHEYRISNSRGRQMHTVHVSAV